MLAAAIQMSSGADRAVNEARALSLVEEAARRGAELIGLPEMWEHIGPASQKTFAGDVHGEQLRTLRALCEKLRVVCLAGSIAERARDGRIYNASALIGRSGEILAVYRKLHLFDVDIPDGAVYRESASVAPGPEVPRAVGIADGVTLGMTVCYDLRFPELYRALGADILCVPAAFTAYTGKAHWEILLRARAIENQAFVFAPAQVGRIGPASENRFAFGHACIVDPWGEVLADAGGESEGMALAELNLSRLAQVRRDLPALRHRRRDLL
ncbi:MAG TPA: carbon-nitrogen hydrolase family protein [Myxococcales bacterium]